MADIVFVCVREDIECAGVLAQMFSDGGCSVHQGAFSSAALCLAGAAVVVWSKASMKSRSFLAAAERSIAEGKAVFVCFSEPPAAVAEIPSFDLRDWKGDPNSRRLDGIFFTVDRLVTLNRDDLAASDSQGAPLADGWTADLPVTPLSHAQPPAPRLVAVDGEVARA
jgi:hypothetical protein